MSYQEFLSFERRGAVGIVRLARPEKLNTISAPPASTSITPKR